MQQRKRNISLVELKSTVVQVLVDIRLRGCGLKLHLIEGGWVGIDDRLIENARHVLHRWNLSVLVLGNVVILGDVENGGKNRGSSKMRRMSSRVRTLNCC